MHLTEADFTTIYHDHAPVLHKYITDKFGPSFADDALSHAFRQFWDLRENWDDTHPTFPRGVLTTLAWRRGADEYRKAKRGFTSFNENYYPFSNAHRSNDSSCDQEVYEDIDLPVPSVTDTESLLTEIRIALTSLPFEQAETIRLVFFEGLTQREIESRFCVPKSTVQTRLSLGLSKLRSILHDDPITTQSIRNPRRANL